MTTFCDQFVGEDLHNPGEIANYGPYEIGDIATLLWWSKHGRES